jgi:hypothetical protein
MNSGEQDNVHPAIANAVAAVKALEGSLRLLDEPAQLIQALEWSAPANTGDRKSGSR